MTFGCLPMIAAVLFTQMREDSGPALKWFTIVRTRVAEFLLLVVRNNHSLSLDAFGFWKRGRAPNHVQ